MVDVDVRLLGAFVAVAEELNFSRAAERMGVAQQGLSAQVRQLESRLDARLFTRTTRRVALTAAGEALLPHARTALASIAAGEEAVRRSAAEVANQLAVAGLADAGSVGAAIVARFAELHPEVTIEARDVAPAQGLLEEGAGPPAAVAFVRPPFRGINRFATVVLAAEPRLVALPADHELADRESVDPSELMSETWAWVGGADRVTESFWLIEDHRYGRAPKIGGRPARWDELLALVAARRTIGLVPTSIAEASDEPGVCFVAVTGIEPSTLALAWRPAAETASTRALTEVAKEVGLLK